MSLTAFQRSRIGPCLLMTWALLGPPHGSSRSNSAIRPDVGRVEANVYHNTALGFRMPYPAGWRARSVANGDAEPDRDTGRDVYQLASFQHPKFPQPLGQITVRAVDLAAGPLRGKELELPDESPRERNRKLKRKRGPSAAHLAGRHFTRTDFEMRLLRVPVYLETKFTTIVGQYALVVTLIADDEALLKELLKTMEGLAFDSLPSKAVCSPPARC